MTRGATASSYSKTPHRQMSPRPARAAPALAMLVVPMLVLLLASMAQAASVKHIISVLDSQRAANGIPAGILENSEWSADCSLHNAYEKRNHALGHVESEGKPGYSSKGNLIAATSVLAKGLDWGEHNPYDNAPYHLFDLLNPRIDSVGASDSSGFDCVEIELGTTRPAPTRMLGYSYPGNGQRGVPVSQRADEQPMTPAQTLGLGSGASGPNLLVYFDGPWTNGSRAQVASASLSSAHGSVALRWLDNTTSNLLAPTGAILVPVSRLRAHTTYRARIRGTVIGVVPGATIEAALGEGCHEEPDGSASCGEPPATTCVEDFSTQLPICGLSRSWPVEEKFSFTTAGTGRRR